MPTYIETTISNTHILYRNILVAEVWNTIISIIVQCVALIEFIVQRTSVTGSHIANIRQAVVTIAEIVSEV